jgi:ATP adenylyltransferase
MARLQPDLARLWAPWRSRYLAVGTRRGRCIFCAARRSRQDRRHHVIARSREAFVLLNRYPYANGHLLVAPYRHVGTFEALTLSEWQDAYRLLQRMVARVRARLRPHGFNLGLNLGRSAGAGIPGHLHFHLVPRWHGDVNFMPVVSRTKVISQSLDELYTLLRADG